LVLALEIEVTDRGLGGGTLGGGTVTWRIGVRDGVREVGILIKMESFCGFGNDDAGLRGTEGRGTDRS